MPSLAKAPMVEVTKTKSTIGSRLDSQFLEKKEKEKINMLKLIIILY